MIWKYIFAVLLIAAEVTLIKCSVSCRNQEGKKVDWFIIYKLPKLESSPNKHVRSGYAYYYMDVNTTKWSFGKVLLNHTGHALYHTLQQIYNSYNSKNVMYLLYNDEYPEIYGHNEHGHTKGDLCFNKYSGFWLVHSVPKFPPPASSHYSYPKSGSIFGQMLLCVTYKYNTLNEIGKQLMYNYPGIYDHNLPDSIRAENPNIAAVVEGKHVTSAPWYRSTVLSSADGEKFTSFAKYTDFEADLYHDWLAPYYKSDVYVESWLNGVHPMKSNCTGTYKAYNIKQVNVSQVDFNDSKDHSKWAVVSERNVTCIGDINRMQSQEQRAGGTVCFQNTQVMHLFTESIIKYEQCPKNSYVDNSAMITTE